MRSKFEYIWQILYLACTIGLFSLWPGVIILAYFIGVVNPSLVEFLSMFSFTTLFLTIFLGFTYDSINVNKE